MNLTIHFEADADGNEARAFSFEVTDTLPSGVDQVVLYTHAHNWTRFGHERRERLNLRVAEYAARTKRDYAWRRAGDLVWIGAIAHGGELHHDLVRMIPRACPLVAWNPLTEEMREPRPAREKRVPLTEDIEETEAAPC